MSIVTLDLVLSGLVYLVLVYFMIIHLKKRKKNSSNNDDDSGGGIAVTQPPQIDLPPGVCLPDAPRNRVKEEREEVLI